MLEIRRDCTILDGKVTLREPKSVEVIESVTEPDLEDFEPMKKKTSKRKKKSDA